MMSTNPLVVEDGCGSGLVSSSKVWWSGDRSFYEAITTLHWCPDDRLSEGVLRFRALYFLAHLVYLSIGQAALFSVDSCQEKLNCVGNGVRDGAVTFT